MYKYEDKSRGSGIVAFKFYTNAISVMFINGAIYTYTYQSAGEGEVSKMKELARSGEGLNSYINRVVRLKYADKVWRKEVR